MTSTPAFCPHCRRQSAIDSAGRCMHTDCDRVVLGGKPARPLPQNNLGRGRGPVCITPKLLRESYEMYLTGMSLRAVGEAIWQRTGYSSPRSCANSLHDAWRDQGWQLRDRVAAARAASYRHGLAPRKGKDREHVLSLRRKRGEIRGVQCSALKTSYGKGHGQRCSRPALRDSEFCANHDPRRKEKQAAQLAEMRARRIA